MVRAQAGAGENQIRSLLMSAGKSFLSEFAGHAGGHFGDQFASAASDYMSSWFGGSDAWTGGGGQNW